MNRLNGKHDKPFYENDSSYSITGFVGLMGCAFLVLSTLLKWKSFYLRTTETERSGLSLLRSVINAFQGLYEKDLENRISQVHITIGGIIPIVFMLIFYAVVVFLIIAAFMDNFRRQPFFTKHKKIIRFSALLVLIICLIVLTHSVSYKNSVKQFEESVSSWVSYIEMNVDNHVEGADHMKCTFKSGPAVIMFWLGMISYLASIVGCFVLDTLNEEDEAPHQEETAAENEAVENEAVELANETAGEISETEAAVEKDTATVTTEIDDILNDLGIK